MISDEFRTECRNYNQQQINLCFESACVENNLDKIKYLLTSPELEFHADIHTNKEHGLRTACMNGNLEIVKFLTSSSNLNEHADIGFSEGTPLTIAANYNHLKIIQYLLESPQLKIKRKNLYEEKAFEAASKKGYLDIVSYFIFERNIKKKIRVYIPFSEEVKKMFERRELKESLEAELSIASNKTKRIKL